jgi:hypothetical protein
MIFEYNTNNFLNLSSKNFFTKNRINNLNLKNVKENLLFYIETNINNILLSEIIKEQIFYDFDIHNNINITNTNDKFTYYHNGYLDYILCAISNNFGFEISPWNIWSLFVKQIFDLRINNLFNNKFNKIIIDVDNENPNFDTIINDLFNNEMYIDKKIFIPDFISNSYPKVNFELFIKSILLNDTFNISHATINNNYKKKNKIKINGMQLDWNILYNSTKKLISFLLNDDPTFNKNYSTIEYLNRVLIFVEKIKNNWNKPFFWENFIMIKHLENINEKFIFGEISNLFYNTIFLDKIPVIISNTIFYNKNDNREYSVDIGIITSYVNENNILTPNINKYINSLDNNIINNKLIEIDKWIIFQEQLEFLNLFNPENIYNHISNNSFLIENSIMIPIFNNKSYFEEIKRKELLKTNYNYWFEDKKNIPFKNNLFIFLSYTSYQLKYTELNNKIMELFYHKSDIENFVIKFLYLQNNNYFNYDLLYLIVNTLHPIFISDVAKCFININLSFKNLIINHIFNIFYNYSSYDQIIFLESHIENKLKEIFNNIFQEEINNLVMSLD